MTSSSQMKPPLSAGQYTASVAATSTSAPKRLERGWPPRHCRVFCISPTAFVPAFCESCMAPHYSRATNNSEPKSAVSGHVTCGLFPVTPAINNSQEPCLPKSLMHGKVIKRLILEPRAAACSHPHDLIPAVHVKDLAGNGGGAIAGEEQAGGAQILGQDVALALRVVFVVLEHLVEAANAPRGQRVHRAGADAVDADLLRAEIVGEIARAGFEGGLGHTHHVVMGYDFLRAVVAHADDAATLRHERRSGAGERHQRIGADVVGNAEGLAAGVDEFAFEGFLGRERYRVQQQVQFAKLVAYGLEDAGDLIILGDITRQNQGVGAKRTGQFLHVILEPLALISER